MAEDKISSIIDLKAIQAEVDATKASVQQVVDLIRQVKGQAINISGAKTVSEYNAIRAELDLLIKKTNLSTKAVENEAKAREANRKAAEKETKEREKAIKAAEREAAAADKLAKKKAEEERPYRKLALAFAAAAKNAQDLAAKYGTMDKRSQEAAKRANQLNNELKKIDATIGNHQRNVGNYGSALDGVGNKLKSLGGNFLALIGIAGVGSIFKSSIDEFIEMDKNVRILQNTLRNIGVPEAFDRIKDSADRLAERFKFLDNDDILKSFNQLIVYGKLTEDQINQLVPVIIDFATATGQDMAGATSTIIKALEGNGKALKEFGINMKDAKGTSEAFNLIMKELKPRVEGVGDAFGDSAAGGLATANQEFKDLKEELGTGLLPVLNSVLSVLNSIVKAVSGGAKGIKDFFSGKTSLVGSIVESSFADDEKAQAAIEEDVSTNMAFLKIQINDLKKLQAEGKKLEDTEETVVRDFLNGLVAANKERAKRLEELKKTSNVQDIKEVLVQFAATQRTINELQTRLEGGKVLGAGGSTGNPEDDKRAAAERLRVLQANSRAEFEIFKLAREQRALLDEKIFNDEKQTNSRRLLALNDYSLAKEEIINATADFELKNSKLTNKEIELVERKRIDALLRLQLDLAEAIKKNEKDFKADTSEAGKAVKGMTKSIADAIEKSREDYKKWQDDTIERTKKVKETTKEALTQLAEEVRGLIFDLFTADIDRESNAIQDQIDLIEKKKEKDLEAAQQAGANIEELQKIEIRAAAEKEKLERRQRQLAVERAKFERAQAIAATIQSTALAVVRALGAAPFTPANIALAAIVGAIGAAQIARALVTPIPKFKDGGTHKGGLMIVGDGGKSEGVTLPDGTVLKTPSVPTLMDAPAGTKIHPDYSKMMVSATITKVPEFRIKTMSDNTERAINKMSRDVVRAIKNQPQPIINSDKAYLKAWRRGNTWQDYITNNL